MGLFLLELYSVRSRCSDLWLKSIVTKLKQRNDNNDDHSDNNDNNSDDNNNIDNKIKHQWWSFLAKMFNSFKLQAFNFALQKTSL